VRWKSVGTHTCGATQSELSCSPSTQFTSCMRLRRSLHPVGMRSVSNMVRPTVYKLFCGGHLDVWYFGGYQAPGSEWQTT
jgi:hypothetical protein